MTFTLTRAQFTADQQSLTSHGVSALGDNGTLTAQGVTISYAYAEPTLTVTVTDYGPHSSWIAKKVVNHTIQSWFNGDLKNEA